MKNKKQIYKTIINVVFVIYVLSVLAVLLFKAPTDIAIWKSDRYRHPPLLIPFKTIIAYASNVHSLTDWFIKNLAANILMFVPWGALLPVIIKSGKRGKDITNRRLLTITLVSAVIFSATIEIVQYVAAVGYLDVDDVILNFFGSIIGVGIYLATKKIIRKDKREGI